jgi:hypothetical protein
MRKLLLILLIIIAVIVLFFAGSFLYMRFMPEKNVLKETTDFTLSASNLAIEYENNPSVSDKKFIDRVIEVTGVISEISTDQNKCLVFILREKESATGVLCTLSKKASKKAIRYKKGDTITLKGTCSGMLFEIVLNNCIIVKEL